MSGEKINLVNQTLKYLLTILTERDRLCLIVFDDRATRLTPLKRNTKENHSFFTKSIDAIFARLYKLFINNIKYKYIIIFNQ